MLPAHLARENNYSWGVDMRHFRCRVLLVGCGALSLQLLATAGYGQTPASGEGIQEIVVTANKREELLTNVGLTVTALSADELAARKVTSLADIAEAVPGLSLSVGPTNAPVLTLRGVGFYDRTLAAIPSVSLYLDEMPLSYAALASQTAFDLERIEVLKGPQGTLFGQSSTGGAINYIAAKPTQHFEEGGDITYGRFNTAEGNFYVSGPVSQDVEARFAFHVIRADDWQQSYVRDDSVGKTESYAARFLMNWHPADTLHLQLNVNGWQDKSDPEVPQLISVAPQFPATANPSLLSQPLAPDDPRAAEWSPQYRSQADNRLWNISLRGDLDLTSDITLTSLSSYIDYQQSIVPGGDGVTAAVNDIEFIDGYLKTFSQELRLANGGSDRLRWVVGGDYNRNRTYENDLVDFSEASSAPIYNISINGVRGTQDVTNYAGFANLDFDLAPTVIVKAGARYTESVNKAVLCAYDGGDGNVDALFTSIGRGFPGNANRPALTLDQCFTLLAENGNYGGPPYRDTLKENNVSWRGGVDYKPANNTLLYVNVSKGYKAGSFPITPTGFERQFQPVTQESVLAYEGGFKIGLFDRKLQIDGAAFHYDYVNKQVIAEIIDPLFGALNALVNIPKSTVTGAELSLTWAPVEGLTIQPEFLYTDAKVTQYVGVSGTGQVANFAGSEIPFSPTWQLSTNIDYKVPLNTPWQPFVGSTVSYRSSTDSIVGGEQPYPLVLRGDQYPFIIDGYALVDLRAGAQSADGKYRVSVWGKNVLNKLYAQNAYITYDDAVRLAGRGSMWGITFGFKFN
jgi:iron complex outermembrane recepter protein